MKKLICFLFVFGFYNYQSYAAANVDLSRTADGTIGGAVSGKYFTNAATLKLDDIVITDPAFLGDDVLCHVGKVENVLRKQYNEEGAGGLSRNHLAANVFVLLYDTRDETKKRVEGTLYARDIGAADGPEIEWLVRPNNTGLAGAGAGGAKIADFVSSVVENDEVKAEITAQNLVPLHRGLVRPLRDDNNHGDRLAWDTISTNPDLFFSLVRKTGHRADLQIMMMGAKYFSTYDACDACHGKLYQGAPDFEGVLTEYARAQNYIHFEGEDVEADATVPFRTFFYASRPYRDSSYFVRDGAHNNHTLVVKYQTPLVFPGTHYYYQRSSLPAGIRAAAVVKMTNGSIALTAANKAIWTHVDTLGGVVLE